MVRFCENLFYCIRLCFFSVMLFRNVFTLHPFYNLTVLYAFYAQTAILQEVLHIMGINFGLVL